MPASVRLGSTQPMMCDGMCSGQPRLKGVALSLTAASDADARRRFDALAEGGQAKVPLGPSFSASGFGMLEDRFGVSWMVVVPNAPAS